MKFKMFMVITMGCAVGLAACEKAESPADKAAAQAKTKAKAEADKKAAERKLKQAERKKKGAQNKALFGHWTDCYKKFEAFGSVDGKLTAIIDSSGKVATAAYRGSAPKPVQNCLLEGVRGAKLPEALAEPASAHVTWNGTLTAGGASMLTVGGDIVMKSAMKPEEQKQLDDALGKKQEAP